MWQKPQGPGPRGTRPYGNMPPATQLSAQTRMQSMPMNLPMYTTMNPFMTHQDPHMAPATGNPQMPQKQAMHLDTPQIDPQGMPPRQMMEQMPQQPDQQRIYVPYLQPFQLVYVMNNVPCVLMPITSQNLPDCPIRQDFLAHSAAQSPPPGASFTPNSSPTPESIELPPSTTAPVPAKKPPASVFRSDNNFREEIPAFGNLEKKETFPFVAKKRMRLVNRKLARPSPPTMQVVPATDVLPPDVKKQVAPLRDLAETTKSGDSRDNENKESGGSSEEQNPPHVFDPQKEELHVYSRKHLLAFRSAAYPLPQDRWTLVARSSNIAGNKADRRGSWRMRKEKERMWIKQPLVETEKSWSYKQRQDQKDADACVVRTMKSILNKLTYEKFDTLFEQLLSCGMSTSEHIQVLMKEEFEKATTQHNFIELYTDLCIRLEADFQASPIDFSDGQGHDPKMSGFRRILLTQCQKSFEENLEPPVGLLDADVNNEDALEQEIRYKTAMLGNIKFVGRLLVTRLLASKILIQAATQLLTIKSNSTLECLCMLLTATGETFDDKSWHYHTYFSKMFDEIRGIARLKTTQSRIKFLFFDLLDLKARNWKPIPSK